MGEFSGTPDGVVTMFRCGCVGGPGCGKVFTEGQVEKHLRCTRCGSRYWSPYYPRTKWQLFKCHVKLVLRGEAWTRG